MVANQRVHSLAGAGPKPLDQPVLVSFRAGRRAAWSTQDPDRVAALCAAGLARRDPITTER